MLIFLMSEIRSQNETFPQLSFSKCFFWTREGFAFWKSPHDVIAHLLCFKSSRNYWFLIILKIYQDFKEPLISCFLLLSLSFRLTFFCNAAVSSLNHELRVSQWRSVHGGRWSSWWQALGPVPTPQRPRASAWRHQGRARWSGSPESQVHFGLEQRQIWSVFMHMIENWFLWLTQNNDTNGCSIFEVRCSKLATSNIIDCISVSSCLRFPRLDREI